MKRLLAFGRKLLAIGRKLKPIMTALEPISEAILYWLSIVTITLMVSNEFVPHDILALVQIPYFHIGWAEIVTAFQLVTWSAYVLDFVLFCLASGQPFTYMRENLLHLTVCLFWTCVPFSDGVLIQQVQSVLSLQTLLVIGTLAQVMLIARGAARRFNRHPIAVLIAAGVVLVTTGGMVLLKAEPQTFHSFEDAAWWVYTIAFDEGASTQPVSLWGRLAGGAIMAVSVSLFAIFIATVREIMSRYLFKKGDIVDRIFQLVNDGFELIQQVHTMLKTLVKLPEQLSENNRLIKEMRAEREEDRRLISELLAERAEANRVNRRLLAALEGKPSEPPLGASAGDAATGDTAGGGTPTDQAPAQDPATDAKTD